MTQDHFAHALLAPEAPEPSGLCAPQGGPAGKRFDVYRNNVTTSLIEALESGFPALRTLIGPQRFKALATMFLRQSPPSDPRMMLYGDAMPDYLAGFPPLAEYPYLPDVARLEMALRRSYHAADAPALDPQTLVDLGDNLAFARCVFAPATCLVHSPWPVFDIWRSATQGGEMPRVALAQDILITRPEYDPVPVLITPDQGQAINALITGSPFGQAIGNTDPQSLLATLLSSGALTQIQEVSHD